MSEVGSEKEEGRESATPDTPEAATPAPGPGAILRQARERAGMAIEDVAAQTNLSRGTLEALERDDFSLLSEAVYVRGYYRKLAKVLPVAEGELLEAYRGRVAPAAAPLPQRIPLAGGADAGASVPSRGRGLAVIVVVVAVLGVLVFLTDKSPIPRYEAAPGPEVEDTFVPPAAEEAPPETQTPGAPADAPPEPLPAGEAGAPAGEAGAPEAATAETALVLEFSEPSFVRVEDVRNRTLAIGLMRGGDRQTLEGQPPYTVFLGNAQHVKVFYKGRSVNFSQHINRDNDTARFSVP